MLPVVMQEGPEDTLCKGESGHRASQSCLHVAAPLMPANLQAAIVMTIIN